MKIQDYVREVSVHANYAQSVVRAVMDAMTEVLKEKLLEGETIKVLDTTFSLDVVPERTGRNPRTGESVVVPEHKKIVVRPASNFKRDVR